MNRQTPHRGKGPNTTKGDRLHWTPLNEAKRTTVSIKGCIASGRRVDTSELSKRGNNTTGRKLVP